MVVTLGQQLFQYIYSGCSLIDGGNIVGPTLNIGEDFTVILCICIIINRQAGTPKQRQKHNMNMNLNKNSRLCTKKVICEVITTPCPGGSVGNLETFWRWDVSSNPDAVTRTGIFPHKTKQNKTKTKKNEQVEND